MRKIFLDEIMQKEFKEDGFAIVPNFLNEQEVAHLLEHIATLPLPTDNVFYTSHHLQHLQTRLNVNRYFKHELGRAQKYLLNYTPFFANLLVKNQHSTTPLPLHQDWCFIDETTGRGINLWVPLVDITADNGYIYVLPGSHRLTNTAIRGRGFNYLQQVGDQNFSDQGQPLLIKKGTAVFMDLALMHGSTGNFTAKPRIATSCIFLPVECKPLHYYRNQHNNFIYQTYISDEFHLHTLPTDEVYDENAEKLNFEPSEITIDDFLILTHEHKYNLPTNF